MNYTYIGIFAAAAVAAFVCKNKLKTAPVADKIYAKGAEIGAK